MTTQEHNERIARAHDALRSELMIALANEPLAQVNAPAFDAHTIIRPTAANIVADQLADNWSEESCAALAEALRIIGACARAGICNPVTIQARAQAWIAQRATEHADFHCNVMAANMAAEGEL